METYDSMSIPTLARKLAHAEINDDETSVIDISDILIAQLAAQSEITRSQPDAQHNPNRDDNTWNCIMNFKDGEYDRLRTQLKDELSAVTPQVLGNTFDDILPQKTSDQSDVPVDVSPSDKVVDQDGLAVIIDTREPIMVSLDKVQSALAVDVNALPRNGYKRGTFKHHIKFFMIGKEKTGRNRTVAAFVAGALLVKNVFGIIEALDDDGGKSPSQAGAEPVGTGPYTHHNA